MTQLGACPGSLSRITELSQHASDGRKSEDGQYIAVEVLNILGVSTAAGWTRRLCAQLSSVLGGPRTPTAHLLDPHLTGSSPAFSSTLTISLRQFEDCACTPAPRAYPHPLHTYARKTGPATPPLHSWRNRSGKVEALLRRLAILGSGACRRGPAPGQRPKLYPSRPMFCRNAR